MGRNKRGGGVKKVFIQAFVSILFIALLFYLMRGDFPEILHALRNVDRPLFAWGFLICFSTALILARRLQLIFIAEDVPIKMSDALNLTFVGYFFNNFLPTSVGGDIVKAMCAARITGVPVKSVTSVLMDRILGLFTFILIPSVSFLFFLKKINNPWVPVLIYSFLAVAVFFFMLLFNRKIARQFRWIEWFLNYFRLGKKIRKIYEGMHNFKKHKGVIVQVMVLSIVGQSVNIFAVYLMALALGARANPVYFFLLVPIVHLMSMVPSLNGLGIRESAYTYFLAPFIGKENAFAIGILWLAVLFLLSLIGGIIYLVRHDYHIRFKEVVAS